MKQYILKELDWDIFIEKDIFSILNQEKNKSKTKATVFALVGDLGVGKTTFSKLFLKKIGIENHIQSPTFSIINSYPLENSSYIFKKIFHIDVYRIEDKKELDVLHIQDIFSNPEHIILIEWADKIKEYIPDSAHWIYFEHDTIETRKILIEENI